MSYHPFGSHVVVGLLTFGPGQLPLCWNRVGVCGDASIGDVTLRQYSLNLCSRWMLRNKWWSQPLLPTRSKGPSKYSLTHLIEQRFAPSSCTSMEWAITLTDLLHPFLYLLRVVIWSHCFFICWLPWSGIALLDSSNNQSRREMVQQKSPDLDTCQTNSVRMRWLQLGKD